MFMMLGGYQQQQTCFLLSEYPLLNILKVSYSKICSAEYYLREEQQFITGIVFHGCMVCQEFTLISPTDPFQPPA